MHRLAYYDTLTGLPNRALLQDRLLHALQNGAQRGMLLLVDIDRFKQINDTRGHATGDLLPQAMARRMEHCLEGQSAPWRAWGAIPLAPSCSTWVKTPNRPWTSRSSWRSSCTTAWQHLSSSAMPKALRGDQYRHHIVRRGRTPRNAAPAGGSGDVPRQRPGRNSFLVFDASMQATMDARVALEMGLRDAIESRDFALYYQAQVDRVGNVVGAEALVRWSGADGKAISPADFIPLAEETGLIVPWANGCWRPPASNWPGGSTTRPPVT